VKNWMGKIRLEIGSALDPGIKRADQENQDSLGIVLPGLFNRRPPLLVIADGMGGYIGGAVASQSVIKTLKRIYRQSRRGADPLDVLGDAIRDAHRVLRRAAAASPTLERMGSTVVAVVLDPGGLSIANVGDSRAYRVTSTEIIQLSYDQSHVADELRAQRITEAELRSHPRRNVLTMSISTKREKVEPVFQRVDWQPGDWVVLCSDGLWGSVVDSQIQMIVTELPPKAAAQKLVDLANTNQGPDNISVIVARWQK
jgi:PPM family protein phosphatase